MINARQSGLSLVELMISVLISSLLLAGVVQVMLAKKDSYRFQQSQSHVQENSRFSIAFLEEILQKTGFRQQPQTTTAFNFKFQAASTECARFEMGQVIADSKMGDGVCIRYQEQVPDAVNCIGGPIGVINSGSKSYDEPGYTVPVIERIYYDSTSKQLLCGVINGVAEGKAQPDKAAYPLVSDIEGFSLRYGIDSNDDRVVDKYLSVPEANDWDKIVSLRFDVLAVAPGNIHDAPQVYRFPLDAATETTAPDRRVYRVATQTIALKNIAL